MSKLAEGMELERLKVVIEAETDGLKSSVNKAKEEFTNLEKDTNKSTTNIANSFGKIGSTLVKAFAVRELINFGQECLSLASDLQEVQNVVDVTFGDMSEQVNIFASNAMEKFGLSETAAKRYAGTMGAMLSSSGIDMSSALEMSTTLTALSADIASFYNLTSDEAFGKIRSGISGETEPLKQLGINMSVANLEAYALSEGITKSYDAMTQAEQATLRYNYLLATTSAQQGDFSRTSDSYANRVKTLSMRFDELKTSIGNGLIVVLTPILEVVNEILTGLINIASYIGNLFGGESIEIGNADINSSAMELDNPVTDVSENLGTASKNAKGVSDNLTSAVNAAQELKKTTAGFDEANVLSSTASSGIASGGGLGDAISSVGSFTTALNTAYGGLNELLSATDASATTLSSKFGNISLSMSQIKSIASQIIDNKDLEKMQQLTNSINTMEELATNINAAKNTIDSYNWMVSIGMELSEKDEAAYKAAINEFTSSCQAYVTEQKKAVSLSCQIVFGSNSEQESKFNAFYTEIQGQLSTLSSKIEKKVNEAWEDGVLSFDEAQEIQNLQNEMYTIMNALNESEFEVKLNNISAKFSAESLNKDSYDALVKEMQDQYNAYADGQDEASNQLLIALKAQLKLGKIDQETFDTEYNKVLTEVSENKALKQASMLEIQINTAFSMVTNTESLKEIATTIQETVNNNLSDMEFNASETFWGDFLSSTNTLLQQEVNKVTPEQKNIIKGMLESLEPTEQQLKALKKECEDAGLAVPSSVSDGLTQINVLKAMTGDVDAMYYLIGNQLSNSQQFKDAVDFAKTNGVTFPQSMIDGMNSKKIDLTNGVDGVLGTVSNKFKTDTTTSASAKENAESAAKKWAENVKSSTSKAAGKRGVDGFTSYLSSSIKKDSTLPSAFKSYANTSTQNFANAINSSSNKKTAKSKTNSLLTYAITGATSALGISSGTSSVFKNLAKYCTIGYNQGIKENESSSKNPLGNWADKICKWFQEKIDIHSPSRVFKSFGGYTIEGYNEGIVDNMLDSEKAMESWGNNIAKWGSDYLVQDFGNAVNASISGNMETDITGSITNGVSKALGSQENNFYAEINIGGEKHVVQFVKQYNKMHASNPSLAFNY